MAILVCAATRPELLAVSRGIRASGAASASFATLLTGVGPAHARRAIDAHMARARPSLVVSAGFAGAVTGRLAVGDWVTASRLSRLGGSRRAAVEVSLRQAPAPAIPCVFVSSEELVREPGKMRSSAAEGDAVDMESATLAGAAAHHHVAFSVLRLVTDTPDRPLPGFLSSFSRAMTATTARATFAHGASGLWDALADPRGATRLVRDGTRWTRDLAEGWVHFARALAAADSTPTHALRSE